MPTLTYPVSGDQGRVGCCPGCRSWISVKPSLGTQQVEQSKEMELEVTLLPKSTNDATCCTICNQSKEYMLDSVCDACFLGCLHPLDYKCQNCLQRQSISHPMYLDCNDCYSFSEKQWACNSCNKFSHWRLCPDQSKAT